jgi:hypothetical protein
MARRTQKSLTEPREPIADFETLGKPELLQLSNLDLELRALNLQAPRKRRGDHAGMRVDEFQGFAGPRATIAGGLIHPPETRLDGRELFGIERGVIATDNPIVGSQASKLDSPDPAIVPLFVESTPQLLGRQTTGASRINRGNLRGIHAPNIIDLQQQSPRPVSTSHFGLWLCPRSKREGDRSVRKACDRVFSEEHA